MTQHPRGEMDEIPDWISEYRQAYRDAHETQIAPPVVARGGGWYVLTTGYGSKYRRRDIEAMTQRLRARVPSKGPTP